MQVLKFSESRKTTNFELTSERGKSQLTIAIVFGSVCVISIAIEVDGLNVYTIYSQKILIFTVSGQSKGKAFF